MPEETHDQSAEAAAAAARERIAIVLDTDDLVAAMRLAKAVQPHIANAKVGLELWSAVGPDALTALVDLGMDVFVDLKLHDIPNQVGRASRVLGALGARYLTMHAHGGLDMLRAGVDGLYEGATRAGLEPPAALAVTVLTSDDSAPPHIMPKRAALAVEAGCGGIVCAASDLEEAARIAPRLLRVVPGIRPAGTPKHDQARSATPREALDRGASVLVIGRAVTEAIDPPAAAAEIVTELLG